MYAYWIEGTNLTPENVNVWDKPKEYLRDFDYDQVKIPTISASKYLRLTTTFNLYDYVILSESDTFENALDDGVYYFAKYDSTSETGYTPVAHTYNLTPDYWAMYQRAIGDSYIFRILNGALIRGHKMWENGFLQTDIGRQTSYTFAPFGTPASRRFYVAATFNASDVQSFWGTSAPPAVMLMTFNSYDLDTALSSILDKFIHATTFGIIDTQSAGNPYKAYAKLKDMTALYLIPQYLVDQIDAEAYLDDESLLQYGSYRVLGVPVAEGTLSVIRPRSCEAVYSQTISAGYDMENSPSGDVLYRAFGNPSTNIAIPPLSDDIKAFIRISFDRVGATLSVTGDISGEVLDFTPSISASIVATSGNAEATQQAIEKTLRLGLSAATTAASGGSLAPLALGALPNTLQANPQSRQSGNVVSLFRSLYWRRFNGALVETSGFGIMKITDTRGGERLNEEDEFGYSGYRIYREVSISTSAATSHNYWQFSEGTKLALQYDTVDHGLPIKQEVENLITRGVRIHSTEYWRTKEPVTSTRWVLDGAREAE